MSTASTLAYTSQRQLATGEWKRGQPACELMCALGKGAYSARVGDEGITVSLTKDGITKQIYKFKPSYAHAFRCGDLVVIQVADGPAYVAWKWCKTHFCPIQNGAVIINTADERVFRLEYEDVGGLVLSKGLADPENVAVRTWLLSWWTKWPGHVVPEKDIIYRDFESTSPFER